MSRQMLFRAKSLERDRWIEGYYFYHIKRTPCPFHDWLKEDDQEHLIICDESGDWNMPTTTLCHIVDKDTVCEYIGRDDINNTEIFEHDIVRCINTRDDVEFVGEVQFKDCSFCIVNSFSSNYCWMDYEVEVIGNIFDNPELLRGV